MCCARDVPTRTWGRPCGGGKKGGARGAPGAAKPDHSRRTLHGNWRWLGSSLLTSVGPPSPFFLRAPRGIREALTLSTLLCCTNSDTRHLSNCQWATALCGLSLCRTTGLGSQANRSAMNRHRGSGTVTVTVQEPVRYCAVKGCAEPGEWLRCIAAAVVPSALAAGVPVTILVSGKGRR